MEFKLQNILESTVLYEGRKEDAIKKYGEEYTDLINYLSENDPSGNNKYLNWMSKIGVDGDGINTSFGGMSLVSIVNNFHNNLPLIKNKDINSYKKLENLYDVVKEALKKAEERKIEKEEVDKIYNDENVLIVVPLTVRASCKYGSGSQWCIAATRGEDGEGYNDHFDDYSKSSTFYFFIKRNETRDSDSRGYKWALQVGDSDGRKTWWDANDDSHSDTPNFVTEEMINAVDAYNETAVKKKLERQIISFMAQPTINRYNDFKLHLTPEQKRKSINDLISDINNITSNYFTILIDDLNSDEKNILIENTKNKINQTDYKNIEKKLTAEEKYRILIYNSQILNNYNIIQDVDKEFSQEDKYNISKEIDHKSINNTDSKVLIKKWSMTEEERNKHGESSFYVFLVTKVGDGFKPQDVGLPANLLTHIESLTKVDPLDPEAYRTINMMKLRKSVQPDTLMYGIKTNTDLLDKYTGNEVSTAPKEILDLIVEKSWWLKK